MKIGDMVRFSDRYTKFLGRMFLVLRRDAQNQYKKYDDTSQWAMWHIVEMETGQIYTQIARDLVVLDESR